MDCFPSGSIKLTGWLAVVSKLAHFTFLFYFRSVNVDSNICLTKQHSFVVLCTLLFVVGTYLNPTGTDGEMGCMLSASARNDGDGKGLKCTAHHSMDL